MSERDDSKSGNGDGLTYRNVQLSRESVLDDDQRILDLSFSSEGSKVLRGGFFEDPWFEVLGHGRSEVDLSVLKASAAVLYNHGRVGNDEPRRLGVVLDAKVDADQKKGRATIKLSKRDEKMDAIWRDIQDGILVNASVGYEIKERKRVEKGDAEKNEPDTYRVTKWLPREISLVDVPADHTVGVGRGSGGFESGAARVVPITEADQERQTMADDIRTETTQPPTGAGGEQPNKPAEKFEVIDLDAEREKIRGEETRAIETRNQELREVFKPFMRTHSDLYRDCLEDPKITAKAARAKLLEALAKESTPSRDIDITADGEDKRREAIESSLLFRVGMMTQEERAKYNPAENPYRGMTLLEIARECLTRQGISTVGLGKMELVGRAISQTTSDFPILLENVLHKALQTAYATQPDTWRRFCAVGEVSDFRTHTRYRVGSIANLDTINEHGEFKNKAVPDGEKETIIATTKGNIVSLTRQVIVNDDLGAFVAILAALGRASARTIEAGVYSLLTANSGLGVTMDDGNPLFDAAHSNIGAGAALTAAAIDADAALMAAQTDPSGTEILDIQPSVLLVPRGLRGTGQTINDSQFDPDTTGALQRPNSVRGLFSDVVGTTRLTGTRRYMFADPLIAPVIEVVFLDGNQSPALESKDGWRMDGIEWRVRHDWGADAIDFRGAVTDAGA